MKKEYFVMIAVGLFVLAYVLDAVTKPLTLGFTNPYQYFTPANLSVYPFSTTSIIFKAIALTITILLGISFIGNAMASGGTLILLSGLLQFYALQDVASQAKVLPLEWSLALTLTGIALIVPAVLYFLSGMLQSVRHKLNPYERVEREPQSTDDL